MTRQLAPEELQLERDLYDGMAQHAQKHIDQSGGQLVGLDYDPETYRAQRLEEFCVETEELAPLDWVDNIGRLVMDNYDDKSAELRDPKSEQGQWLRESGERIQAGETGVIATTHKKLIDVAIVLGTAATALRYEGFEFETAIPFYRMMSVLGYKFMLGAPAAPCIDVTAAFTNYILQSITQTQSVRKSGLMGVNEAMPAFAETNNEQVKAKTRDLEEEGGAMIGLAYNAAVWKWNADGTECVGERITPGTAAMMAHPNVHVLEINFDVVEKDGRKEAYFEIGGPPRKLSDPEESHEVAERMVGRFNDHSEAEGDGRPYVYETAERAEAARLAALEA